MWWWRRDGKPARANKVERVLPASSRLRTARARRGTGDKVVLARPRDGCCGCWMGRQHSAEANAHAVHVLRRASGALTSVGRAGTSVRRARVLSSVADHAGLAGSFDVTVPGGAGQRRQGHGQVGRVGGWCGVRAIYHSCLFPGPVAPCFCRASRRCDGDVRRRASCWREGEE